FSCTARPPARAGQRRERRLHGSVQRPGQDAVHRAQRRPRGLRRVPGLPPQPFALQDRRVLGPLDLGLDLRTGSAASIPTTDEWTYTAFTSSLSRLPSGWCLAGTRTCAQFFGGVTSSSP